eukprot:125245-Prymnesium_polylepis.1
MSEAEASKDGETTEKPHPRRSSCRAYSRRCSIMESQSAICESRTPDAGAVAASVSAFHLTLCVIRAQLPKPLSRAPRP